MEIKDEIPPTSTEELQNGKENQKKKKGKLPVIIIIILLVIIAGLALYICYDKEIIFSKSKTEIEEKKSNTEKQEKEQKDEDDSNIKENKTDEIKPLNINNCLNNNDNTLYSNPTDVEANNGLSMQINPDKKSITLSINWEIFGPLSTASSYAPQVLTYQITGFTKEIVSTFVGVYGQDSMGITLFYITNDNTVQYTPMFVTKIDSKNNHYFEMNYTIDGGNTYFTPTGTVNGANDIIKLYTANASNGSGWITTIGAKKDGSFYDLGRIINE